MTTRKAPKLGCTLQMMKDRNNFLRGFLSSSMSGMERLSCPSTTSSSRDLPCDMRFHERWQHPECPVMRWYQTQYESGTQFTRIQHWRCLNAPFFHEFLIIPLTNGSLYRIERIGDGSKRNAIRWIGCTAHDIIQYFSAEDYASSLLSQQPSELLIEIHFPRTFDLLDVLAICYSVQKCRRTYAYTLQRFNCYFLCCTVLAILTRRAGGLESTLTEETWSNLVSEVVDDLSGTEGLTAHGYLSLGICSLFDSENQIPVSSILNPLRAALVEARSFDALRDELSGVLWAKDIPAAVKDGLQIPIQNVANAVLGDPGTVTRSLRAVLRESDDIGSTKKDSLTNPIQRALGNELRKGWSLVARQMYRSQHSRYRIHWAETQHSLSALLLSSTLGPLYGYLIMWVLAYTNAPVPYCHSSIRPKMQLASSFAPTGAKIGKYIVFNRARTKTYERDYTGSDILADLILNHFVTCLERLARRPIVDTTGNSIALLQLYLTESIWGYCLLVSVSDAVSRRLQELDTPRNIGVCTATQTYSLWAACNIEAHMMCHIHNRAQRVAAAGLAFAHYVQEDTKDAIVEVWENLPRGFGRMGRMTDGGKDTLRSVGPRPIKDWFRSFERQ